MREAGAGWWEALIPGAGTGTRYGFSLNGGDPRPDPRSMFQPEGVLAMSEVVDHGAHPWRAEAWSGRPLAGLVIYELHMGTFSAEGTFDGAVKHLRHIVELGVNAVELMPVAEFSGERGWGYDGVDLFAPHHAYGGPAGLKRLVDACHTAGLAVILDVVYNHLGPAGNFLPEFGPYFSDVHHTDWGAALNFDGPGSDEVRRFVIDNALMWIRDYHFDGLRLDAVQTIVDQSPTHVLSSLWSEVHALAGALGRTVFVIAETDTNDVQYVRSVEAGGYGLDAAWSDDWHHCLHAALSGERAGYYRHFGSLDLLGAALSDGWVYDGPRAARRNLTRRQTRDVAPHQLVVAAQNHDQVGNRMTGDRLPALVDEGRARIAAALLLTTPFTPMLFQGEEWAAGSPFQYFTDHADPGLGEAVSAGRRREFAAFGWNPNHVPDPQDPATFERSKLDWGELRTARHRRMLEWYRALLGLRARLPRSARSTGVEVDEGSGHLVFHRDGISVAVNLGETDWRWPAPEGVRLVLASEPSIDSGGGALCLPPSSVAIVETSIERV
jgi:maltooligosyltrehalose trehalohydrolase